MNGEEYSGLLSELTSALKTVGGIDAKVDNLQAGQVRIEAKLDHLNGTVRMNCDRISRLEEWRKVAGEPTVKEANSLRVEVAKMSVLGGSFGVVLSLIAAVLRALGVV